MVSAELKVVGGKHAGQVIPLNRRKFLIGREQDCQLRPNSEMVSRHHCVFSIDDYSVRLRDLGSTNGTLVNGTRIRKDVVLIAGDKIIIGNLEFELVVQPGVTAIESDSAVISPKPSTAATTSNEDTQVTEKTVHELPVVSPTAAPAASVDAPISAASQVAPADTTVFNMPPMMPGQHPYQQMMPQMSYPGGMYGGYPYQQPMMPGYGQMYPQMMPQMMPQQGYPMPGAPQQAPAPPTTAQGPAVVLPDPADTGAKEADVAKGSSGSSKKDTDKPTGAADAIIQQYRGRR